MSVFQATYPVRISIFFFYRPSESGMCWTFSPPQEISVSVDVFMSGLTKIDVDELTQDNKECAICKIEYAPFAGLEVDTEGQVMLENPVKLACGHIFGESCLRSWISTNLRRIRPTCPICRVAFEGIRNSTELSEQIAITLDELEGVARALMLFEPSPSLIE